MNATQARKLTESTKKDIDNLMETIEAMASAGRDYAVFEIPQIKDLQHCTEVLENLGYNLEITEKYLSVNW